MRFCFLSACITGREHLLNKFIESARNSKYSDCDYYLYYQDVDSNGKKAEFDQSFFKDVYVSNSRDGACLPRMYWLDKLDDYDYYIIIDDDMEFLGKENFEPAMAFAGNVESCGVCCTSCCRTKKDYYNSVLKKKFTAQNIQWVAGGQIIKRSVRELLLEEIPMEPLTYDGFSFVTYLAGYTNYHYWGSVTLHVAGQKNGVEYVYRNSEELTPHFEQYILKTHDDNGKMILPHKESDLTEEAREIHRMRSKRWEK